VECFSSISTVARSAAHRARDRHRATDTAGRRPVQQGSTSLSARAAH
jgi:hypothetical protein